MHRRELSWFSSSSCILVFFRDTVKCECDAEQEKVNLSQKKWKDRAVCYYCLLTHINAFVTSTALYTSLSFLSLFSLKLNLLFTAVNARLVSGSFSFRMMMMWCVAKRQPGSSLTTTLACLCLWTLSFRGSNFLLILFKRSENEAVEC